MKDTDASMAPGLVLLAVVSCAVLGLMAALSHGQTRCRQATAQVPVATSAGVQADGAEPWPMQGQMHALPDRECDSASDPPGSTASSDCLTDFPPSDCLVPPEAPIRSHALALTPAAVPPSSTPPGTQLQSTAAAAAQTCDAPPPSEGPRRGGASHGREGRRGGLRALAAAACTGPARRHTPTSLHVWRSVADARAHREQSPPEPAADAPRQPDKPSGIHGDMRDIWQVATAADLTQLRSLLAEYPLLPDMLHPRMRLTPLLAAAHRRTDSTSVDAALKTVMLQLVAAGDPLLAVEPFSGNTALHILSAQHRPFTVKHRLQALVMLMEAGVPWRDSMLVARNATGKLPEDVASTHATWLYLRRHRLRFQEGAAARGDMPPAGDIWSCG